ncbi:hypothetical protein [Novosphingobium huizhouense]|uniref:hypothetical protein n=1 Tax=Novosphingobium huizhouense TaxID=2866625 RepID=UPI001CD8CE87|nr:hypothetical protein [Novosphingobium huizhouense]
MARFVASNAPGAEPGAALALFEQEGIGSRKGSCAAMPVGWIVEPECRDRLLERFPPRYAQTIAHHVTRHVEGSATSPLPPRIAHARVVGRADDGAGCEALVVAIDGSTTRTDGGTWHITWSLAEGRAARESNTVIAERGWEPVDGGPVKLEPAAW